MGSSHQGETSQRLSVQFGCREIYLEAHADGVGTSRTLHGRSVLFGVEPGKGAILGEVLKADLDAIRTLAERQHGSASEVRGIDPAPALAPAVSGLPGSDTASRCSEAATMIADALAEVAGRIDALAQANRQAADTIGLADETYAKSISATLNLAP